MLEGKAKTGAKQSTEAALPEGLPKVKIDGVEAAELPTELGTLLSFERSGVRYLLAGSVSPAAVEAVARGPLSVADEAPPQEAVADRLRRLERRGS